MSNYSIPLWLIIFFLSFQLLMLTLITFGVVNFMKKFFSDKILLLDKANRWELKHVNVRHRQDISIKGKKYFLTGSAPLNGLGKAFYVFSENKPTPMDLKYNSSGWLSAETLNDVINNKLVQQIVKPTDKLIDILIVLGAIGGIIAGLASVLILLIQAGVIKMPPA